MTSNREPGFYWVQSGWYYGEQVWKVARWDGECWWLAGSELDYYHDDFLEIDERRIVREGE